MLENLSGPTIGVIGVLIAIAVSGISYAFHAFSTGNVTPMKVIISLGAVSIAFSGIIGVVGFVS
jgi:hypothetical protein